MTLYCAAFYGVYFYRVCTYNLFPSQYKNEMQKAQRPACRVWIDKFGFAVYIFKTSRHDKFNEVLDTHTRLFSYTVFSSHLV